MLANPIQSLLELLYQCIIDLRVEGVTELLAPQCPDLFVLTAIDAQLFELLPGHWTILLSQVWSDARSCVWAVAGMVAVTDSQNVITNTV